MVYPAYPKPAQLSQVRQSPQNHRHAPAHISLFLFQHSLPPPLTCPHLYLSDKKLVNYLIRALMLKIYQQIIFPTHCLIELAHTISSLFLFRRCLTLGVVQHNIPAYIMPFSSIHPDRIKIHWCIPCVFEGTPCPCRLG